MGTGRAVAVLFAVTFVVAASLVAVLVAGLGDDVAPPETAPTGAAGPTNPHAARSAAGPATQARSGPPEPSPAPRPSGAFRLTGQVIDDEERPVAGATVRTMRGGAAADETRTDAGGRFVVRCGERPETGSVDIGISATYGPVRAAWESYELMDDATDGDDVGQIQLEPAIPIVARVEDANGPVEGARVFVGSFFGAVFAEATTDRYGVARFDTTPETDAWLFAYAKGRGRARGEIPDGRDPAVPLVLTLSARSLRVSIVEVPAGDPLAGERIVARLVTPIEGRPLFSAFVPPLDLPVTGATGTIVIDDVGAEDAVEFSRGDPATPRAAWRSAGPGASRPVAQAHEIEARIDVQSGHTLRWRIVPGEVPPPAEGDVVALRRGSRGRLPAGPAALHVEEGFLVGHGFASPTLTGVAVARDGAIARLEPGGEARFLRPRTVGVTVCDEAGAPLPASAVLLRSAIGGFSEMQKAGGDGRAAFAGLEPDLGVLDVGVKSDDLNDPRWLAAVDATRGDAEIRVRVPREQTVVLRVTTAGEPKLPRSWRLLVDSEWQSKAEAAGEASIRFAARAVTRGAPIHVVLRADGFLDGVADVTPSADGSPVTADVALETGGTLFAEYRPPPAPPPGVAQDVHAFLCVWLADESRWTYWRDRPNLGSQRRPDADGRWRFDAMPPGRYRIAVGNGYAASEPVDVVAGRSSPVLRLDLSKAGRVTVHLVDADGAPAIGAWAAADGPEGSGWSAVPIRPEDQKSATVLLFVPGDRTVRISARHRMLRPDPEKGFADVREPGEEVTLRLVQGPVVTFTAPAPAGWRPPSAGVAVEPGAGIGIRLLVYPGGPAEGPPALSTWSSLQLADGLCRFGGIAAGRATFWIQLPWGAPVVVRDLDVPEAGLDLGTLRAPRGSSIRVRFDAPEGQSAPRLSVSARRLTEPVRTVQVTSNGESEIELPGLGEGRYEVAAARIGQAGAVLSRVVDVDGDRDVVVEASPR